ncbi:acyl-CoA dehydrogenase [Acetobacter sp. LMG 1627]|uniref:Acyl-CoA dehydrogenase n=1 Tax=Acetobacter conturbans TaxID=1737472 RepID=A0ABX0K076_9PROT|nr:acyl-CoA dehydrogenase [Acetobacter conturbans]
MATFRRALTHLAASEGPSSSVSDESLFPSSLLQHLTELGALTAPLPVEDGGLGLCSHPYGLMEMLRLTGCLSLSMGRCLEGHVNVLRLVALYGAHPQRTLLASAVKRGTLAGIWVTDGNTPVTITPTNTGYRLTGKKGFSSAVHEVGLALITARTAQDQTIMALVPTNDPVRITAGPGKLTGMTASGTGAYDFTGLVIHPENIVGQSGDYLRQPEFSAGAWRGSAVALGGMDRLTDLMLTELRNRKRDDNLHQQVRIGNALILRETASMWVCRAARAVCSTHLSPGDIAAIVNLARIAVEQAALELIPLVQRGLGLSAFVRGQAVEQVMRDLATYLRQPAPDETLTEAAHWFTDHPWPEDET